MEENDFIRGKIIAIKRATCAVGEEPQKKIQAGQDKNLAHNCVTAHQTVTKESLQVWNDFEKTQKQLAVLFRRSMIIQYMQKIVAQG